MMDLVATLDGNWCKTYNAILLDILMDTKTYVQVSYSGYSIVIYLTLNVFLPSYLSTVFP